MSELRVQIEMVLGTQRPEALVIRVDCVMGWTTSTDGGEW